MYGHVLLKLRADSRVMEDLLCLTHCVVEYLLLLYLLVLFFGGLIFVRIHFRYQSSDEREYEIDLIRYKNKCDCCFSHRQALSSTQ